MCHNCYNSGTSTSSTAATSYVWSDWVGRTVNVACSSTTSWSTWTSSTTAVTDCVSYTTIQYVWREWVDGRGIIRGKHFRSDLTEAQMNEEIRRNPESGNRVESLRERAYRLEQQRIESDKHRKEAEARERKAYEFLMLCLNAQQQEQFKKDKFFEVSVVGGKKYRIHKGQTMNIKEIDDKGKVKRTLCFHPKENLHDYDAMAIQKLTLECDEESALKVANFS